LPWYVFALGKVACGGLRCMVFSKGLWLTFAWLAGPLTGLESAGGSIWLLMHLQLKVYCGLLYWQTMGISTPRFGGMQVEPMTISSHDGFPVISCDWTQHPHPDS
jgi:hypothetical protein